jgi:large subunit ribosomal protein L32|uniref:Large ribosomal subunit protein bL32c n=1 Tax=Baffinella frigidus TaxID=2571260 RepID=A0A7T8G5P0_9CRYP|nr:ribosomal protein L32 [Cryptophyta sp. CCMP2293]
MAVPKKRTSKSKTNSRYSIWVNKADIQAKRALSLAKSLLKEDSGSFVYTKSNLDTTSEE